MRKRRKWNLKSRLISYIRRAWLYSPMRQEALAKAKLRTRYRCALCKKSYNKKDVTVDHISPAVGTKEGWQGWDRYIEKMFCGVELLQIVCYSCHRSKTRRENDQRRRAKRDKNKAGA